MTEISASEMEIDLSEFVSDDINKEDLRFPIRETSRMKWILLPSAIDAIHVFSSTKEFFSISKPHMEIRECSLVYLGKRVTKVTCMKCPCCIGIHDDYVECFYNHKPIIIDSYILLLGIIFGDFHIRFEIKIFLHFQ